MAISTLQSKRYSQAAFEIALEHQETDVWQRDLGKAVHLAQDKEFVSVMENPKYSLDDKKKLINNQLKGIRPMSLNLIYILTGQGKFSLITEIYHDYLELLDSHRGIDRAEVITAIPLEAEEKAELSRRLEAITGKKVIITEKIDPDILGGMIAKVGGRIIDGSTRSQLSALKNELINAGG